MQEALGTKQQKDDEVIDYFDYLITQGMRRREAIRETCKKFNIVQPMTLYNTELRVRKRQWEERHGYGKA